VVVEAVAITVVVAAVVVVAVAAAVVIVEESTRLDFNFFGGRRDNAVKATLSKRRYLRKTKSREHGNKGMGRYRKKSVGLTFNVI
jgi:hypothetical protein